MNIKNKAWLLFVMIYAGIPVVSFAQSQPSDQTIASREEQSESQGSTNKTLRHFELSHATAADVMKLLNEQFTDSTFSVSPNTNSVFARVDLLQFQEIKNLLADIDVPSVHPQSQVLGRNLIRMKVQRDALVSQFGEGHPRVKTMDLKIQSMQRQVDGAQQLFSKLKSNQKNEFGDDEVIPTDASRDHLLKNPSGGYTTQFPSVENTIVIDQDGKEDADGHPHIQTMDLLLRLNDESRNSKSSSLENVKLSSSILDLISAELGPIEAQRKLIIAELGSRSNAVVAVLDNQIYQLYSAYIGLNLSESKAPVLRAYRKRLETLRNNYDQDHARRQALEEEIERVNLALMQAEVAIAQKDRLETDATMTVDTLLPRDLLPNSDTDEGSATKSQALIKQLQAEFESEEHASIKLAKALKREVSQESEKLIRIRTTQLIDAITNAFSLRIQIQEAQLDQAQANLDEARKHILQRRNRFEQIIQKRARDLLKDVDIDELP